MLQLRRKVVYVVLEHCQNVCLVPFDRLGSEFLRCGSARRLPTAIEHFPIPSHVLCRALFRSNGSIQWCYWLLLLVLEDDEDARGRGRYHR